MSLLDPSGTCASSIYDPIRQNLDAHWWHMPIHNHNILVAFPSQLIGQAKPENTSPNDDYFAVFVHL